MSPSSIALAESLGADRLELANTQYLGWALANRQALLPTREQLERARDVARAAARSASRGRMEVLFVTPDYYAEFPEGVHGRLGAALHRDLARRSGRCPAMRRTRIPGLDVRQRPATRARRDLARARRASPPSAARPGWPSPAGAATRRSVDFGGCRCQAYHLTGDAAATDPVCTLSPRHELIETARAATADPPAELVFRSPRRPARA